MTEQLLNREKCRQQVSESAQWHVLSHLLRNPGEGWASRGFELIRELGVDSFHRLIPYLEEAREGDYLALLGPGGSVSPREVAYRGFEDPGHLLADLKGFYKAFSFSPRPDEPVDHISSELDFLAFLKFKAAYARALEKREEEEITALAMDRFLDSHLDLFTEKFCRKLSVCGLNYLELTAGLLLRRLNELRNLSVVQLQPE